MANRDGSLLGALLAALLHESACVRTLTVLELFQSVILIEFGRPRFVMRLSRLTATRDSVRRLSSRRERSRRPMIVLYRKTPFSTRACR